MFYKLSGMSRISTNSQVFTAGNLDKEVCAILGGIG